MINDRWHYPRTEFAEQVFTLLAKRPIHAVRLFAPRRTGKTEFLLNDLAPYAAKQGHKVVYVDFWRGRKAPLGFLFHALDQSLRRGSIASRLHAMASKLPPGRLNLKVPAVGEIEMDLFPQENDDQERYMLLIDQYCERLTDTDKPTFLLFDEFQELAHAKNAESIIITLRSNLDMRKAGLVAVFAGSSQEGLRQVFSERDAPFYRYANSMKLPPLNSDFVEHQLNVLSVTSKVEIDLSRALKALEQVDGNPMLFRQWLVLAESCPSMSDKDLIVSVYDNLAEEFGYNQLWLTLPYNQRIVARMLAERVGQMYGREGSEFIEKLTGSKAPPKSMLLAATKKLVQLEVIDRWESGCIVSDPLFEKWIKSRPADDF